MALRDTTVRTGRVATAVRRRPVLSFSVLLLTLSWPYMLATRDLPELVQGPMVLVGPSACAFAVVALVEGRTGARALWRGVHRWRAPWQLYLFVLVGVPATWFAAAYAVAAVRYPESLVAPPRWALLSALVNVVPIVVVAGLGEEFGWRGFVLPRLQDRHGPMLASLVLGLMWFAWHLPLTLHGPDGTVSTLLFLVEVPVAAVVYTWVFNRSGGSVLLVALLHGANNTVTAHLLLPTFGAGPPGFLFFVAVKTATLVLVAAAVALLTRGRLGRPPYGAAPVSRTASTPPTSSSAPSPASRRSGRAPRPAPPRSPP